MILSVLLMKKPRLMMNLFSFPTQFILFVLFIYHRTRGVITSGVIWTFLFFNSVCTCILVLDIYLYNESNYLKTEIYVTILNFLCNALLFIICSFTDDAYEAGLRKKAPKIKERVRREDQLDKEIYDDNAEYRQSPEAYQSFPSSIFFSWFTKLIWFGRHGNLTTDNLWNLEGDIKIDNIINEFGTTYNKEMEQLKLKNKNRSKKTYFSSLSLLKVFFKEYGVFFLTGSITKLAYDIFQFLNPKLLELLITFAKDKENRILWHGALIVIMILFVGVMKSLLNNLYFALMMKIGMKVRSNIINQVYRKSLKLSSNAKKDRTTGQIVNLISVDANRFQEVLTFLVLVWSGPFQIVVCIYFLYQQLGVSVFAGVACIVAVIPINGYIINWQKEVQLKQMKYKDERIKLMNEILAGVRILKLYAWEERFMDRVSDVRTTETSFIKKSSFISLASIFFFTCTSVLVSIATFTVYIFSDKENVLTPEKAFVSISLFSILQFPINLLPSLFNYMILAGVSLKRINSFLNAEEIIDYVTRDYDNANAVAIEGKAMFTWDSPDVAENHQKDKKEKKDKKKDAVMNGKANDQNGKENNGLSNGIKDESEVKKENFSLKDIELKVKKGSFTCIIGQVGSGELKIF